MYTPEETKLLLANHNECTFSSNELYASALKYIQQLECSIYNVYKIAKDIKVPTTEPKWISVEERLPEQGTCVLAAFFYYDGYRIRTARYIVSGEEPIWSIGDMRAIGSTPTHWMPLPEPPEEEATGNGIAFRGVNPDNAQE